jgi:hypothetical protein
MQRIGQILFSRKALTMKRAVSISIGSSKRNKSVNVELLGEKVSIERIGTDGDMEKAAQLYKELDGKVDAFGVGGADLGVMIANKWYPLYSVQSMVRFIEKTPVVDGAGLKNTLEYKLASTIDTKLGSHVSQKRVFLALGADRWGMSKSFLDAGYDCVFGDLMFGLGLPIPIRSEKTLIRVAGLVMPIVGRLPFKWVYPTGDEQDKRKPKWEEYFRWASVIAGDCHYLKRSMPESMDGKVIATNTTTPTDVALFKKAGVKYLVTSTPVLEGRSFGTNMMEAALIAASGKGRKLTYDELNEMLDLLGFEPQVQEL